jgi:anti-sigma factor RsiW
MNDPCEQLDAYLADDLPADAAAEFADHLRDCAECQEAVAEQQWIDGLLRTGARESVDVPRASLIDAMRVTVHRRRRRTQLIACGLAVAASLLIAFGWIAIHDRTIASNDKTNGNNVAINGANGAKPQAAPRATFVVTDDSIAVPVASRHSNVTVVRVYSSVQPQTVPSAMTSVSYDAPPGDDDPLNTFNGG